MTTMSIDIEKFEHGDTDALDEPTNAERVVSFLARHDDRAWKQSEIAARTGVKHNSIGTVLRRLHDQGLVRHKGEYWAITDDDDRLTSALDIHRITERLDERYGREQKDDWVPSTADTDGSITTDEDESE